MKALLVTVSMCALTLVTVPPAWGVTWFVPSECPTIQAGIDTASVGDTVLVADGTYTGPGNKNLDFGGKDVLLLSENGPTACIIDCERGGRGFYFGSGETGDLVVDGFTVTHGDTLRGGALYLKTNSNPTIANCIMTANKASEYGGGIYCWESSPTITNCTISGDTAGTGTGFSIGGGICCSEGNPVITGCTISGNVLVAEACSGVGIYCGWCDTVMIGGCTIQGNVAQATAASSGGGIRLDHSSATMVNCTITENEAEWGGGVCSKFSTPTITKCAITENVATLGGGINCDRDTCGTITNCRIFGNTATHTGGGIHCSSEEVITNCLITGNTAEGDPGGGIYAGLRNPIITNCTITENGASEYGGALSCYDCSPVVANCILWGDTPDEIHSLSGTPVVCYSDVEGGWAGDGNIDSDPLFCNPGTGDFRLTAASLCVDAGDDTEVPPDAADLDEDSNTTERTPLDLDSLPRFVDPPSPGGTGVADPPDYPEIVDMGAYDLWIPALDPANSSVEWNELVCDSTKAFVCPCGGGSSLRVTTRDQYGEPFRGVVVRWHPDATCRVCTCPPDTAVTDTNGVAILPIHAGLDVTAGPACCVVTTVVTCLGDTLPWKGTGGSLTDTREWLSPDMDADCEVGVADDFVILYTDWMTDACRTDFDCSGLVNATDYAIFAFHYEHACTLLTDLEEHAGRRSPVSALAQNYPNPFNPRTCISFSIARPGEVVLRIYDVAGRQVRVLVEERKEAGEHAVFWDGCDDRGTSLPSGVYFCRLVAPGLRETRKMVILR